MIRCRQQNPRVGARWSCAALAALASLPACRFDTTGIGPFARQDAAVQDRGVFEDTAVVPDAAPDGAGDGGACVEHACVEGELICVTASGDTRVERTCPLWCNATGDDCATFQPANFDADLLSVGTGQWSIAGDAELDTAGAEFRVGGSVQPLPTGVELFPNEAILLVVAHRVHLAAGAQLRVTGDRPLVIAATDAIVIEGTIDCGARGAIPGPGGHPGASTETAGAGCGGGFAGDAPNDPLPPYLGGGGGGFGGAGGAAGLGTKPACGVPGLEPLTGGSSGGGGADFEGGGQGGAGGGALQLTAIVSVRIAPSGVINCGGGGGGGGTLGSGGGGGSGGAILVEASRVWLEGTLAANGGGGGGGTGLASPDDGWPGDDGQPGTAPAGGGASGSIPGVGWAGAGGAGSAGEELDGAASEEGKDPRGGGGGGAGRILIRTAYGTYEGAGVVSPAKAAAFAVERLQAK